MPKTIPEYYIDIISQFKSLPGKFDFKLFSFADFCEKSSPYSLIQAEITLNNISYSGNAVASDKKLASVKAIHELIERVNMNNAGIINSNGFATHFDIQSAQNIARDELIERDAYLYHHLNKIPFHKIKVDLNKLLSSEVLKTISFHGLDFSFFEMTTYNNNVAILCCLSGKEAKQSKEFGCILGMSYSNDHSNDIIDSFFECYKLFFTHFLTKKVRPISIENFKELERSTPIDHTCLGLDLEFFSQYTKIYLQNSNKERHQRDQNTKQFEFIELDNHDAFKPRGSFKTLRAIQEDLIGIPFFEKGIINKENLPKSINENSLHDMPHLIS